MIKMTIAIPTYNRYSTLCETLDSIENQWRDEFEGEVEVLVSDNASDDQTASIVEYDAFVKTKAKYYRNETNIGADRNFINCWEKASGKYVLILSDDDVLFPGTIGACLDLFTNDPDIVFLKVGEWKERKNAGYQEKYKEYHSDSLFIDDLGLTIVVLSSLILKRELIDTRELNRYIGTFFSQVYATIEVMKKGNKHYIVRETPSIGNRPNNQRGYNLYDQWLVYYQEAIMHFTELGLSKSFCKKVFRKSIKEHIQWWLYTFADTPTKLDLSVKPHSIMATILYPESWRFLYPAMIKLARSKKRLK